MAQFWRVILSMVLVGKKVLWLGKKVLWLYLLPVYHIKKFAVYHIKNFAVYHIKKFAEICLLPAVWQILHLELFVNMFSIVTRKNAIKF